MRNASQMEISEAAKEKRAKKGIPRVRASSALAVFWYPKKRDERYLCIVIFQRFPRRALITLKMARRRIACEAEENDVFSRLRYVDERTHRSHHHGETTQTAGMSAQSGVPHSRGSLSTGTRKLNNTQATNEESTVEKRARTSRKLRRHADLNAASGFSSFCLSPSRSSPPYGKYKECAVIYTRVLFNVFD